MSILACLGADAESLRDIFLTRLAAATEDIQLKVVIVNFLSVCVDTQPGLVEVFLSLAPDTSKKVTVNEELNERQLAVVNIMVYVSKLGHHSTVAVLLRVNSMSISNVGKH